MREQLWNTQWQYWESENAFGGMAKIGETKDLTLPHDAMLEHPAREDSKNGLTTGHRDGAVYNYRKKFFVPESWREQTSLLKFEGVYMNAFVFVNEEFAGKCHYGYNTFYVELDKFLRFGEENEVHVIVKNSGMRNSRWYSGGGIYRDVYLVQGGLTAIERDSLRVHTISADEQIALLDVSFETVSRLHGTRDLKAKLTVTDADGKTAASDERSFLLFEGSKKKVKLQIPVENPALWSHEAPNPYKLDLKLSEDEICVDQAEVTFGIRTISIDAKRGLLVNGKAVKLKGSCIHHDSGILGAAAYEDAHIRQMKKLKEAGFNAVRMSHHPMGQTMLRACDRIGLYVMDETFDMWNTSKNDFDYSLFFDEDWKITLKSMAEKDFSHPSVILYSLGNEIPESGSDHGIELMHEMADYLRTCDPTRPVTEAINGVFAAGHGNMDQILSDVMEDWNRENPSEEINDFMTVMKDHLGEIMRHPIIGRRLTMAETGLDLLGYNYMASRYQLDLEEHPHRVIFGSETYPPAIVREWDVIEQCPNVIGEFTWTGWDYLGEVGVGIYKYAPAPAMKEAEFPNQLAFVGDIDITGYRRPMSYLRQIVFEKQMTPCIAVQDPTHFGEEQIQTPWTLSDVYIRWNYAGYEGKPVIVEVYSAAEETELLVNGRSCGRKPTGAGNGYRALFEVTYEPGCLTAVSYNGGLEVGRGVLKSASEERHLVITEEEAYGPELIFLNIEVRDAKGVLAADVFDEVRVEVEGASLLGLGSGSFAPKHNFSEHTTEFFGGRAQVILRKNGTGKIHVKAFSEIGYAGNTL